MGANPDLATAQVVGGIPLLYRQRSPGIYAPEHGISDVATGSGLFFSTDNEMMTSVRTSVLRGETNGTVVDVGTFSVGTGGTGAITVSGGEYHLVTGGTAGSVVSLTTLAAARHYPGTTGYWIGVIRTSTNTLVGTSASKWGFFGTTDGFFFYMLGTDFGIGYRTSGSGDTLISYKSLNGITSHFNPATDLVNMNQFNIIHGGLSCRWQINGRTIHTIGANQIQAPLTAALSLPSTIFATNGGGDNFTIHTRGVSYSRVSPAAAVPLTAHYTTQQTNTIVKTGPSRLVAVIGSPVATAATVTVYDSTGTATAAISTLTFPANWVSSRIDFGVETTNGITVTSSQAIDFTVLYE